jgi:hypothetical protein
LIGPRKEKKKLKFWNLPNIEVFFVGIQNATSFWHINIIQKHMGNFGQSIWDKSGVLLQTPLGTH